MEANARQGSPSLGTYLAVLKRRAWVVLIPLILLPAAAYYQSSRETPQYQASSDVLLSTDNLAATVTGVTPGWTDPVRDGQTQAQIARVLPVAARALEQSGITDRTATDVLGGTQIIPDGSSDLLHFVTTDSNPDYAARLSAAYAKTYVDYRSSIDGQAIEKARQEIARELTRLREEGRGAGRFADDLRSKDQQLATVQTLQSARAKVVRTATGAAKTAPEPRKNLMLGLFFGLLLGAGLAFAAEALDTRLRSSTDLADTLGLQLLARLPEAPKKVVKADELVMMTHPTGPASEAFRMLRTNLDFVRLDSEMRTFLVTSAREREGKSTTTANLAVALARAGTSVVLVDLDLRKPAVDRLFRLPTTRGLTDVALGKCSLDDALTPIDLALGQAGASRSFAAQATAGNPRSGTLQVLTTGPLPPDPGEFIGTPRLSEILFELRSRADVILIDTPPVMRVGDALTLSAKADGVIVIANQRLLRKPMLAELRRVLDTVPARKVGLVVTGSDGGRSSEYGYGYGYGYGYSTPVKTDEKRKVEDTV